MFHWSVSLFLDRRCRVRNAGYGGGARIADRNAGRRRTGGWRFRAGRIIFGFHITLGIVFTIAKEIGKKVAKLVVLVIWGFVCFCCNLMGL